MNLKGHRKKASDGVVSMLNRCISSVIYHHEIVKNSVLISFEQTLSGVNEFHPEHNFEANRPCAICSSL
jgi:hypothetical protein